MRKGNITWIVVIAELAVFAIITPILWRFARQAVQALVSFVVSTLPVPPVYLVLGLAAIGIWYVLMALLAARRHPAFGTLLLYIAALFFAALYRTFTVLGPQR